MTPKKQAKQVTWEACFQGSQGLLRCVAQSSQKIKRLKDLHVVGSWYIACLEYYLTWSNLSKRLTCVKWPSQVSYTTML